MILLLSQIVVGCVSDVDVDPDFEKQVVVNCVLTGDSIQNLTLTWSANNTGFNYDEVEDAEIVLNLGGERVGEFKKVGYKQWQLRHTPVHGGEYQLRVSVPGQKDIIAVTTFPKRVPVYRARSVDDIPVRFFHKMATPVFWMFAFEKEADIYMGWNAAYIGKDFNLLESVTSTFPDIDDFNIDRSPDRVFGTKHYYAYMRMLPNESSKYFSIAPIYSGVIVVRAVSAEYDEYMKTSIEKMQVYWTFYDPLSWFDEGEIYSNIENGLGIFGAYYDQLFKFRKFNLLISY